MARTRRPTQVSSALALALVALAAGCGGDGPGVGAGHDASVAREGGSGAIDDLAGGRCDVEIALPPSEGGSHVATCTAVTHQSKPPSSGPHYGTWPVFRVYDKPVPWGFLVHGLEHGAVVIAYHCAGDCDGQLAEVRALYDAAATKPACGKPPLIVTPDPSLDVPFAASAWGATLRARCFDRERFAAFVERRANRGPELFPTDCGASDFEAAGWCAAAVP
jgi:hypothetical protein